MDDRELDILISDAILARRRHAATDSLRFGAGVAAVFLLLVICLAVAAGMPFDAGVDLLVGLVVAFSAFFLNLLGWAVVCWPMFFAFVSTVRLSRQNMFLLLLRTAMETGAPIEKVLRCYAMTLPTVGWFRGRIERITRRLAVDRKTQQVEVEGVAQRLESGETLLDALTPDGDASRSPLRSDLLSAIELGQADRAVVETLQRTLGEQYRRSRTHFASMLRFGYLFVLLMFFLLILSWIMLLIVPKFVAIFNDFDTQLPGPTVVLMYVSNLIVDYWYLGAIVLVWGIVPVGLCALLLLTGAVDWRPWGFRRLFNPVDAARLLTVLRVGMERNLPFERIFTTFMRRCPVAYTRRRAERTLRRLDAGESLAEALRKERYLDGAEAAMVATAERLENAPFVLRELAAAKEQAQLVRGDFWSKMLFLFGLFAFTGCVGFTVVALFLPLVRLIEALC